MRNRRGTRWLEDAARDLRYAVRTLRKRPAFARSVILTLALGIGAASTIFSLFNVAYLGALPYSNADGLVVLWQDHRGRGGPAEERFNPPDFQDVRERSRSLEAVAAQVGWSPTLTGAERPERLSGLMVSHEYFGLFGGRPAVGRFFSAEAETPGGARSVVIGHGLWQSRFGGDSLLVGRTIELDGDAYTVAAVASADFQPPGGEVEVWRPLRTDPGGFLRMFRMIDVVGRLAPGVSLEAARAELEALSADIAGRHPESNAGVTFRVASLEERILGPVRPALFALLGGVALILVIACANVAGLLLARGAPRGREVAVRAVLGARRGRLLRQLLSEGLLLGLLGGPVGVILAIAGIRLIAFILPPDTLPRAETSMGFGVAAVSLVLSLATSAACALLPALRLSKVDLAGALKTRGSRGATANAAHARSVLIVAEIALSLVLLAGAGLFLRSFVGLIGTDPGFRSEGLLTAELSLGGPRYKDAGAISRFYQSLLAELGRRPDVRSAGATSFLPLRGGDNDVSFEIEGRARAGLGDTPLAWYRIATAGYFRTMGIPVVSGRVFTDADRAEAPGVVLVNETLARRYWPGTDPVGRRVSPEWADGAWLTVVGVVGDVRHNGLSEGAVPELYFPHSQMPGPGRAMTVVVRTAGDPGRFAAELRDIVWTLDSDLPIERVSPMNEVLGRSIALPRLHLWTFGSFALLALALAAVGLYGVVSTVVAQRTHEIGVRIAIGARPTDVMQSVLRWAAALVLLGVGIGLLCAIAFARTLESLLYGLSPTDPATFGAVVLILGVVALLACLIPARRAARVDPVIALRAE